jgi:ribosome-binding protein aMBF1 (putative translation factor)
MRINPSSKIGGVLREARLAAGVSQGDLAEMLGLSIWCLNRVEHDKRGFDTEWVTRMPATLRAAVRDALAREVGAIQVFQRGDADPQPRTA